MTNVLRHPHCFRKPARLTRNSGWHEHIPFGMFLVGLLKPRLLVELGTSRGDSYCAFCQAVKELALPAKCFGVDTWQGDPHAGFYGPEILADLRAHHDPLYGSFSTLLQCVFEEAAPRFQDGSVDLLHIDGYHAYEAVSGDFRTWLPKMSDRGVVLFHDIAVRQAGFGVWRLWDDLKGRFPCFEFPHGHGLGVLGVGPRLDDEVREFLSSPPEAADAARALFAALGGALSLETRHGALEERHAELSRVYSETADGSRRLQARVLELEEALAEIRRRREWKWIERYHRLKKRLFLVP